MLDAILKGGHLYYSRHYDLTNRLQKQHAQQTQSAWERVRKISLLSFFPFAQADPI